jgi:hypothetical protein
LKFKKQWLSTLNDLAPVYEAFPMTWRDVKYEPVITTYATKNAEEFFCEAFAYTVCDKLNIKAITKLVDYSINQARGKL